MYGKNGKKVQNPHCIRTSVSTNSARPRTYKVERKILDPLLSFFYEVNVRTLRGIKPARVIQYLPLPPVVKSGHLKP